MSASYYLSLAVASTAVGVYNISSAMGASTLQCYSKSSMDQTTYDSYLASLPAMPTGPTPPPATSTVNNGITTWTVPVQGGNLYQIFNFGIAITFGIILLFSLILSMVTYWLSDMVPDDFLAIGRFKKFTAVTTKLFPPLLVIISWINMILIAAYWIIILMGSCEITTSTGSSFGFNSLKYGQDAIILNIVNSVVWFLTHYVFAIIKDVVYTEPFMYSPQVGEKSMGKEICFRILGP